MSTCKQPFMVGNIPAGCGRCMPCRISRQRVWTHRMMLEGFLHAESTFLTLTYDDEHLPPDLSLDPQHTTLWIKRFREQFRIAIEAENASYGVAQPTTMRFYLVGEYGDTTLRPHYHAALFGVGHRFSDLIKETWGQGNIMLGDLTPASCQYICGYVLKKMTAKDDPRLQGRFPEFARMSRNPGIGAGSARQIADLLFTRHGTDEFHLTGDVPNVLQHGRRKLPLGRYLKGKIRDEIGMPDSARKEASYAYDKEMSELFKASLNDPKHSTKSFRQILIDLNLQKVRNLESKQKIHQQGKTL